MAESPTIPLPTLAETLEELRRLIPAGSPLNNRDPFGVWETYTTLAAQVRVDDRATINALLPQGYPVTATGAWLDQHARSLGLSRIPARRAEHDVLFSVRGAGTVPAGSIVQTELDFAGNARRFVVVQDTDLPVTGGLVRVVAEEPGTAYNVGAGRIQGLVTVLPFVTGIRNDPDTLVVAGVDAETDDLLRERLRLRWPALSRGSTYHAYVSWAREVPGIVKVKVLDEHPRGQGTVDVVVAPQSGMPTSQQISEVDALVQVRRPITANALVRAPTAHEVNVNLRLFVTPQADRDTAHWAARVQAVFDALTIGETFHPSRLADALHNHVDVLGVELSSPIAHVTPAPDALVVPGRVTVELT